MNEIMEHVKAIKQWCEIQACENCYFYECRSCALRDNFPFWWKIPTVKTFAEVFLEKFPDSNLDFYGTPYVCVRRVFGQDSTGCDLEDTNLPEDLRDICHCCWNKIAPKEYQE